MSSSSICTDFAERRSVQIKDQKVYATRDRAKCIGEQILPLLLDENFSVQMMVVGGLLESFLFVEEDKDRSEWAIRTHIKNLEGLLREGVSDADQP